MQAERKKKFYDTNTVTLLDLHFADVTPNTPIEFYLAGVYVFRSFYLLTPKTSFYSFNPFLVFWICHFVF